MPTQLLSEPDFRPVHQWLVDAGRAQADIERVATHWRKVGSDRVPFCPRCFLDHRRQVLLHGTQPTKYCPVCRATFIYSGQFSPDVASTDIPARCAHAGPCGGEEPEEESRDFRTAVAILLLGIGVMAGLLAATVTGVLVF